MSDNCDICGAPPHLLHDHAKHAQAHQAQVKADATDALLAERGKTHGRFEDHARCARALKRVFRDELKDREHRRQPQLTHEQVEALDMIFHKVGRIVAGDASHADHWDDIAGYARLGRDGGSHSRSEPRAFTNAHENYPHPCPDLDQECCGAGDCKGCPETAPRSRLAAKPSVTVGWQEP